jgi:hypothetical protein
VIRRVCIFVKGTRYVTGIRGQIDSIGEALEAEATLRVIQSRALVKTPYDSCIVFAIQIKPIITVTVQAHRAESLPRLCDLLLSLDLFLLRHDLVPPSRRVLAHLQPHGFEDCFRTSFDSGIVLVEEDEGCRDLGEVVRRKMG